MALVVPPGSAPRVVFHPLFFPRFPTRAPSPVSAFVTVLVFICLTFPGNMDEISADPAQVARSQSSTLAVGAFLLLYDLDEATPGPA